MPHHAMTTLQRHARLAALCFAVLLAPLAAADTIKVEGLPLYSDGVTIIGVKNGEVIYRTNAGDQKAPLADVEAITLAAVPEFGEGMKAFSEDKMRGAQRSFEKVWAEDGHKAWIRQFAGFYLLQVYDKRNEPVEAARVYGRLAAQGADLYFLKNPPLASLKEADEDAKKRITDEIMAVAKQAKGEHKKKLQTYLRIVGGDKAPEIKIDPGDVTASEELRKTSKVLIPAAVWKVLDRKEPKAAKEKWEGLTLLTQGEYQKSLDKMKPWLSNKSDLVQSLFIYGRAQLALADEKKDKDLYLDAGLTFMRIVVHYDFNGNPHALVAPAKLEVAYIHKMIGREDIFKELIYGKGDQPGVNAEIDDKEKYPEYRKRYYKIIGKELPKDDEE